jgi:UDP-xylose/UDP-N-acetylglucosamine transporter B4
MNMVIGFLVFQKRYGVGQILCALSINAGLVMLTLTAKAKSEAAGSTTASSATAAGAPTQLLGIGLLCITVVLSALLGLLQDNVFRIGRSSRGSSAVDPAPIWAESMFFCHVLCLPFFFLTPMLQELTQFELRGTDGGLVLVSALTQYVCIRGVYQLVEQTSSFTMTLVLTLRKFVSLAVSIWYFGHHERLLAEEWLSMGLVLGAGGIYTFVGASPPTGRKGEIEGSSAKKVSKVPKKR